ncbi:nickel-dependent hydrogenase large subunit [Parabacteroides distasonis]|nr:nickel-dependent hydrogenase large subunit [Parabacteroides distasonis]
MPNGNGRSWPDHEQGVGLAEAPRGALAHFIVIDKNRVKNYRDGSAYYLERLTEG